VELQVAVQELQPVQTLPLELVLKQQLVLVRVLEQELVLQLAQVLLLAQLAHCDRCSRVHLLV